jgi:hypothetical protein
VIRSFRTGRRAILATLAAVGLVVAASPALADNDVGCGVGTMLMEGNTGVGYKLLASCTNGITFQSISITFGLVNCDGTGTVTAQLNHFTGSNIDQLAADMAQGEGETLTAFSTLLQVAPQDRDAFGSFTQSNFAALFPSDTTTAGELLENLDRLLREDARLQVYARS